LYSAAASGTSGSLGFGSQSRLKIDKSTLPIVRAGDLFDAGSHYTRMGETRQNLCAQEHVAKEQQLRNDMWLVPFATCGNQLTECPRQTVAMPCRAWTTLPLVLEDVEADAPVLVDVWMVYARRELQLRWTKWIVRRELDAK